MRSRMFGLLGATVLMIACGPFTVPAQQPPAAPAPDTAAEGAAVYARNCAACHGGNLQPSDPIFDLRDLAPGDRQRFVTSVTRGKDAMPAWGALLTTHQIDAVWDFLMSRTPAPAPGAAQAPASSSQTWPCGGDPRLLADDAGNPVWIGAEELTAHAAGPTPGLPAVNPAAARLTADVLIDPQGRVKCVRATPGAASPPAAALDALRKWTFRPFSAAGQPVAVYARLPLALDPR